MNNYGKYEQSTKETYERVAPEWKLKRGRSWKSVESFLKTHADAEKVLVDLGCGTGRDLISAEYYGFQHLMGIDYAANQLSQVPPHFETCQADLTRLPLASSYADVILCIAAFHHLLDPDTQQQALEEMERVLKKGGIILLSVWQPGETFLRQIREKGKLQWVDDSTGAVSFTSEDGKSYPRYYYFFKEDELQELLSTTSLILEETMEDSGNLYLILRKKET